MKQLVKVVDLEDQIGPKIEPKPERAEMAKDFLNLPTWQFKLLFLINSKNKSNSSC